MQYINLNLTETNTNSGNSLSLTDLALGTESAMSPQRGGGNGFFSSLFGSNENEDQAEGQRQGQTKVTDTNKLALIMAKDKNWAGLESLVKYNSITDFTAKDADGNTVLHYVADEKTNPKAFDIVKKIVNSKNVKSFVNIQNKDGDPPLHLAVRAGNHKIANLLVKKGARKTSKIMMNKLLQVKLKYPQIVARDKTETKIRIRTKTKKSNMENLNLEI